MRIAFGILALLVLAACSTTPPAPEITSFAECVAAGNPVMESYPRQCAADGLTFTEEIDEPVMPPLEDEAAVDENPTGEVVGDSQEPAASGAKEFDLVASNWKWEPSTITVQKGDAVTLRVTSVEGGHGLAIAEFGVKTGQFGPGETKTVTFTADKAGEFRMYCNVMCGAGHRDMVGALVVEE